MPCQYLLIHYSLLFFVSRHHQSSLFCHEIRCYQTATAADSETTNGNNEDPYDVEIHDMEEEDGLESDDDNDESNQPWKTLLELPARAAWIDGCRKQDMAGR